ncbi:MAG: hypothetical protein ACJA1L_000216 [Paracoccaceae bacterium]|jgi:hypothetical protein
MPWSDHAAFGIFLKAHLAITRFAKIIGRAMLHRKGEMTPGTDGDRHA